MKKNQIIHSAATVLLALTLCKSRSVFGMDNPKQILTQAENLTENKKLLLCFDGYKKNLLSKILVQLEAPENDTKPNDVIFTSINDTNVISPLLENTIARLPLTKLYLEFKNLDQLTLCKILTALNYKHITELLLCENFFGFGYWNTPYDPQLYDTLANTLATLFKLTTLKFNHFWLSQEKFDNILKSLQKTSITKLILSSNYLKDVTSFDGFKNLTQLTQLDLDYCNLNKAQLSNLLGVLNETTINHLEIAGNPGIPELNIQDILNKKIINKNNEEIGIRLWLQ